MHSSPSFAAILLAFAMSAQSNVSAAVDSLAFVFDQFKDNSPPSGPGINSGGPLFGPTFNTAKLSDYQVTLLNDATVFGLSRRVDGIALQRDVNTVTLMGGNIPPSTFNQTTRILLVTEDLGLFRPGATLADWDAPFTLDAGSQVSFTQSSSYWTGGNPFNPLGGMQTTAMAWEAGVASFSVTAVPEPSIWGLGALGAVALLGALRRRRAD